MVCLHSRRHLLESTMMAVASPQLAFRSIVHVDMDAFFASVEELDHPELRGQPIVVGADPRAGRVRSVVSSANYVARRYGVRAAQPVTMAWRLCPNAVFLPPRFARYSEVSDAVMEVLSGFSERTVRLSIDEAVLDCSNAGKKFGTWKSLGRAIKDAIKKEIGLSCTIGIATGKTLAKMACELHKPDGLTLVPPGQEKAFLAPLPVEAIPGVGPRAREILQRIGIHKIADLQQANLDLLVAHLGKPALELWQLACGIDNSEVIAHFERKSYGEECTYDKDLSQPEEVAQALKDLAEQLEYRLAEDNVSGRTVTLKVRFADFRTITRAQTVPVPIRTAPFLEEAAWRIFRLHVSGSQLREDRIRLLGIQLSNLYRMRKGEQLWLF